MTKQIRDKRWETRKQLVDKLCKEGVKFIASTVVVYVLRFFIPYKGVFRFAIIFVGIFTGEIIGEALFD